MRPDSGSAQAMGGPVVRDKQTRFLMIGASGSSHVGESFFRAAKALGYQVEFLDTSLAWRHGSFLQKIAWHFLGRRPLRFHTFGRRVVDACKQLQPDALLTTGMSPLSAATLRACGQFGVRCANFSTDDPFSASGHAAWFLKALREYDLIFTPRHANLEDFKLHGCSQVAYLRFGYDQDLFFPPKEPISGDMASDLFFAGAADRGRFPFIAAAVSAGLNLRLHGIYWDKYPETRAISLGQADIPTIRRAVQACRVALCVVRHENRDGHAMRSFEVPAVGACLVVEDTEDHRDIFGDEGECASYFRTPEEMVAQTRWLLSNDAERMRRAMAAHQRIIRGANTYADRLKTILDVATAKPEGRGVRSMRPNVIA